MAQSPSRWWPLIKLLPVKTNFRFMRLAKLWLGLSLVATVAAVALTVFPFKPPCGGLNCGIDFKGGTIMEISTAPKAIDLAAARAALGTKGLGDVQVQGFGDGTSAMVRFEIPRGANATATVDAVRNTLTQTLGQVKFGSGSVVGPKVSGELFRNGVLALALGIAMMMVYIWFRFGLTFGVGAAVALLHDVLLTFGLFAVTQMEFSLNSVAAILTIIGYSVNDTVVVLDRFRENLRKFKRMPLADVIDLSINETLSRTAITGVTGIMALTVLAVFGGETLFGFSVAMIFGILVGTYSSFFVAAPVILMWGVKRGEEEEAQPLPPQGAQPGRRLQR
jgi:preprotein translocase subunit SecF